MTLYLTACLTKYDLLVDPLVVTSQAKYQDFREFVTEVRIAQAEVAL